MHKNYHSTFSITSLKVNIEPGAGGTAYYKTETNLNCKNENKPRLAPNILDWLRSDTHLQLSNNFPAKVTVPKFLPNPVLLFGLALIVSFAELWEQFVSKATIEIIDDKDTPE
jgi:hypothetical protein